MQLFNKKHFWITILGVFIIETFSLTAYHFNSSLLSNIGFFVIFFGVLLLSLRNIEWGVLIAFVDLLVSSFGHLFKLDLGPLQMTMRVGIFFSIQIAYNTMLITHFLREWTGKYPLFEKLHAFFQKGLHDSVILTSFFKGPYFYPNWAIFAAIVLGFVMGLVNGNSLRDIFKDMDAYVVFAYFPIMWAGLASRESRLRLYNVFAASMSYLAAQTLIVLFIFAHRLQGPMRVLYLWIRDARIGEITLITNDFYRIFFQSYIYALVAIFIFAVFFIIQKSTHYKLKEKSDQYIFWLYVISAIMLLVSFSRSFWFGGAVAVCVFAVALVILKVPWSLIWRGALKMLGGFVVALAIVIAVVNFPFPKKGPSILIADLLGNRALSLFGEAAATSRWTLLPILWNEVMRDPILGSGFGKTITYKTDDPRYLAEDPTGMRKTYAFEWGYLDMWLKMGVLGLFAFGWLMWRILSIGWLQLRQSLTPISFGVWLGLIALLGAHFFTPFLNHPLGIGIIIFAASIFRPEKQELRG